MKLRWLSPAKLNLFLHITGRRPDGYHELQTLFQFLDYCDEFEFESRDDGIIELENPIEGVANEDNLIIKAANKLKALPQCRANMGVSIKLKKNLPMGGGLGGGSSNAATTLLALNQLWELHLSRDELKAIGLTLGADVPVFIHGEACLAEGVGEQFSPVSVEESWFLVIKPDCHVNTGEIFLNPSLTRNTKNSRIRAPMNWEILGSFKNDCESVVRKLYPDINQALDWLSQYGLARMTGTGSCVFSPFPSEEEASKIATLLPKDMKALIAKGVNKSPGLVPVTLE